MIAGVPLIYGQTGRVDRFKTDPEKPAMQPTSSKTELGATEEVDLSTLDNILDIMDFSKEDPDLPDDNTEI